MWGRGGGRLRSPPGALPQEVWKGLGRESRAKICIQEVCWAGKVATVGLRWSLCRQVGGARVLERRFGWEFLP